MIERCERCQSPSILFYIQEVDEGEPTSWGILCSRCGWRAKIEYKKRKRTEAGVRMPSSVYKEETRFGGRGEETQFKAEKLKERAEKTAVEADREVEETVVERGSSSDLLTGLTAPRVRGISEHEKTRVEPEPEAERLRPEDFGPVDSSVMRAVSVVRELKPIERSASEGYDPYARPKTSTAKVLERLPDVATERTKIEATKVRDESFTDVDEEHEDTRLEEEIRSESREIYLQRKRAKRVTVIPGEETGQTPVEVGKSRRSESLIQKILRRSRDE